MVSPRVESTATAKALAKAREQSKVTATPPNPSRPALASCEGSWMIYTSIVAVRACRFGVLPLALACFALGCGSGPSAAVTPTPAPGGDAAVEDAASKPTDVGASDAGLGGGMPEGGPEAGAVTSGDAGVESGDAQGPPPCSISSTLVPSCGAWFGAHSGSESISTLESHIGRNLDTAYYYHEVNDVFPTSGELSDTSNGTILDIDWYITGSGSSYTWADVSNGAVDTQIKRFAASFASLKPRQVMLAFNSEPESGVGTLGTAPEFALAFRHVHQVAVAAGATNIVWVWALGGWKMGSEYGSYENGGLYPGDDVVDWITWDPYNWLNCQGGTGAAWMTFSQLVSPLYTWLMQNGHGNKPFGLAEYGSVEDPANPDAKEQFFEAIPAALQSFPNLKLLQYFNSFDQTNGRQCNWTVETSTPSLNGFTQAGAAAYLDPTLP